MDFERDVADLQCQVFGAPYGPVGSAVSSFHFDETLVVDVSSERLHDVLLDDVDLQASVKDCWDVDAVVNEDIDFLEGETESGLLDDDWKEWGWVGIILLHGSMSRY